ncbi:hypothetical protein B0H63DRAFT_432919 [Podospora didyma]|uniref:Polyketide synthase n=1 Tax=Podospora didyma TaxID=330526 RepID=A0AAE0TZE3_9PEZI|nr:hypothetical protein B0H63DRAFT_432919 [Podospora didyma]
MTSRPEYTAYPNEPIAIIGSACRFPGDSSSPSKLWELLREPRDVLREIPVSRFNPAAFYHEDALHHGTSNVKHSYLLDDDIGVFDAQFFGIKPVEANSVDPQQRILLETVYEGLERAGLPLETLQGSRTSVYVGVMSADYTELLARDINTFPTYFASGTARSILSNRISYFFDWHGPSMTIDTACSSSLFALHLAVQSLRAGESPAAIVAGANLVLGPDQFVAESKLKMLSPDGRSRMWDKDANGYARGDGVAALVLKTLSAAIADGDTIECIIRETGINQDGRTKGITMPSPSAQADLIRSTYRKAGLDLSKQEDRPQYFEAHGTGTPAGDPVEAEAISTAFFGPTSGFKRSQSDEPLYVGSIKTVIGHTEGTAGVAGVIKASLALQHGIVPPNLLLNELSSTVKPFYGNLEILKDAKKWPTLPGGVPRRVSVNSFGFGGANGHVVLESYNSTTSALPSPARSLQLSPFLFSAASENALTGTLAALASHLRANDNVDLRDLSWTLNSRRSTLPVRLSITAATTEGLISKLEELSKTPSGVVTVSNSNSSDSYPRLLGIFTGQGAQWASMGAQLLAQSKLASDRIQLLQEALDSLPAEHAPAWSLFDELSKDKNSSRVGEAAFSQPLCTAVQIVLVDHLRAANVRLAAVVGHSSGEIAAAYAAGYISAQDAIRIAYYRGYLLHLSASGGAMMAVGTTLEDAQALCELDDFVGRVVVAASNSPESQTLSGDSDAMEGVKIILEDENKFARFLKVDKAYHSHHMIPCTGPYVEALKNIAVKVQSRQEGEHYPSWISSVYGEDIETVGTDSLGAEYWSRNMANQVLFTQAVEYAVGAKGPFDLALEVGPHPALKGPALQTIQAAAGLAIPYTGTLRRGANDIEAFAEALGSLWTFLGSKAVDFTALDKVSCGGGDFPPRLLKDLPTYAWDHERVYWHESRYSKAFRTNSQPPHQLLGTRVPDGTEKNNEVRWKNQLHPREVPWVLHHQVERQIVFPAAGYLSAALEAVVQLYGIESVQLLDIQQVTIGQALVLEENSDPVETLFSLRAIESTADWVDAVFTFYSASGAKGSTELVKNASGQIRIALGAREATHDENALPAPYAPERHQFLEVEPERFYSTISEIGLGYTGPFRKLAETSRRMHEATGLIQTPEIEDEAGEKPLLLHPGTLDCAIQAIILAHSYPGDGRVRSIHLPTGIDRIRIDPWAISKLKGPAGSKLPFFASVTSDKVIDLSGDVEIHSQDGSAVLVQLQGLRTTPLTRPAASNDVQLFFETSWEAESPTSNLSMFTECKAELSEEYALSFSLERVAYFYVNHLYKAVAKAEREELEWHFKIFFEYIDHVVSRVADGTHPYAKTEWNGDSREDILSIIKRYPDSIDLQIMQAVGENLEAAMRNEINILEPMIKDNKLTNFYAYALGMERYLFDLNRMVGQISRRFPHISVLEIGAGTGGATEATLKQLGGSFSSYTYTDISSGFFEKAQERFEQHRSRMVFKVLDIEKDIEEQGYAPQSFDLVIASLVLHATRNLEYTLKNVRKLLKPGGRLLLLELTDNDPIRFGFIFGGLPGWWLGSEDGRKLSPCVSAEEWEAVFKKTGFSTIEAITPHNTTFPLPLSVICTQAVDDRVTFLRDPLSTEVQSLGIESLLTIVGGTEFAKGIEQTVRRHYQHPVQHINSLEAISHKDLPFLGTVVSLVDLDDEPTFQNLTTEKVASLKDVFRQSKKVIWVTRGALADSPTRNMYRGLQRTIVKESQHLQVQFLDFDTADEIDSAAISSRILQLEAGNIWEQESGRPELLWYQEPEVLVQSDGKALVPRVRPSTTRNDRYNSGRRLITQQVSLDDAVVTVRPQHGGFAVQQQHTSIRDSVAAIGRIEIQLSHSLLRAIAFPDGSFLHLSTGYDIKKGLRVVLVSEDLNSRVRVPQDWTVPIAVDSDEEETRTLLCVHTQLVADSVLSGTKVGEAVAVLDPGYALGAVVAQRAAEKGVQVVLLSSKGQTLADPWVSIHPRATGRSLERALPRRNLTRFFNVGGSRDLVDAFASHLPRNTLTSSESRLAVDFFSTVPTAASNHLRLALAQSSRAISAGGERERVARITLSELATQPTPLGQQAILSWRSSSHVPVHIQPATELVRFRKDRTYWMVGLTGSLGLSLCEWMARRGAGYIVLSSRNPKVDQGWLQGLADQGCTVKVFANDITNRDDVQALYKRISQNFPPIAGVSQGAMVLHDSLFPDVDLERVHKVLRPKVSGSIYLDEIFSDDKTLDFFVFFSSVAYVTGNAGQSIYGAANAFMASLAAQRRRRGLAASVINIGAILGTGYVSRELSQQQQEYLRKVGHVWMSEQDAHEIFAEGVLASSPGSTDAAEFETGFRTDKNRVKDLEAEPPMFQHLRLSNEVNNVDDGKSSKHTVKTKARLLEATDHAQVFEILKEGFLLKLQIALQADPSKPMLEISLDELGADSLVAVDIRSWFLKELGVDLPVLKILNAPSVRDLLVSAQELLSESAIPNVSSNRSVQVDGGAEDTAKQAQTPSTPAPAVVIPVSEPSPTSSTRSDFDASSESPGTPRTSAAVSETDEIDSSLEVGNGKKTNAEASRGRNTTELMAQRSLPMSFGQSRFWFLKHYVQDQTAFNISTVIKLRGKLEFDALEKAVVAVGQRHEALRTFFYTDDKTKKPTQAVLPAPVFRLERATITDEDKELQIAVQELKNHVFDLEQGEALRVQLLSVAGTNRHYLLLGYHHIYLDGIGYVIFISDLDKAYSGALNTKPAASEVLQYPDFTARQIREYETGAWADELSFWRKQFSPDLPKPLPLLPLAGASARPVNSAKLGLSGTHTSSFRIPKDLAERITQVSRQFKVTPFHLYVAVFHLTLYRYYANSQEEDGGEDDTCIGVADGNRKDADVLQSLGMFLNVLPLRLKRSPRHTFADTLRDVRTAAQGAFANSRVPFDVLLNELGVPREPSHSPLFQAFVNYRQNTTEARRILGCDGELDIVSAGQTDYDISLDILDLGASGPIRPNQYPTIVHRIDAIAAKYPDRTALKELNGRHLTYGDLTKRVAAIAEKLSEHGISRGAVVSVFQTATADWTASLLAILRLGGVYVPLDLKTGVERLSVIARDARPTAIVVDAQTSKTDDLAVLVNQGGILTIDVSQIPSAPKGDINIPIQATSTDLATILYSSGSTGVPKGVELTHSNFSHYGDSAPVEWGMREGQEVFLHQASYMFDASLLQTIIPLGVGSTIIVAGSEVRGDPAALSDVVARENITFVGATPTEYLAWARHWNHDVLRKSAWRVAFTWGEPMSKRELCEFQRLGKSDLKLVDAYGPVETTISVGHGEVPLTDAFDDDDKPGNPRFPLALVPNVSVRIVNEALQTVPAGVVGEIVIGGAGVGKGYLKDDDLTAAKFIPDGQTKAYRSGDRGWLTRDGRLVLQGRIEGSTQIKLAGIRIDLQDVEAVIAQVHPQRVRQVIVSTRKSSDSTASFLAAFVELLDDGDASPEEQARFLFDLPRTLPLPQYMRPAVVVGVPQLPTNSSGKLDRRTVDSWPLPDSSEGTGQTRTLEETNGELSELETTLSSLWAEALPQGLIQDVGRSAITSESDFFHLGGSSLALINLQALIKERLDLKVPMFQLFQTSTLGALAAVLEQLTSSEEEQNVDWENEIALPSDPLDLNTHGSKSPTQRGPPTIVALTGSTGFIGREILRQLLDNSQITKVYLLAVRKKPADIVAAYPDIFGHDKVVILTGDLGLPRLGLSEAEAASVFEVVNTIIHSGADVSFLKTYQSLRLVNVASTRELIRLAAPRHIPLHFVSSAAVARLAAASAGSDSFGSESAAAYYPPPPNTNIESDGYAVAKLVSEVLLERAAEILHLPVHIHRPSSVTGDGAGELDLMANMARYAREIGAVPDTRGWEGRFDFVRVETVAREIISSVLDAESNAEGGGAVRFSYQSGEVTIDGDDVQKSATIGGGPPLGVLPFDEWVGRAEGAGLNSLLGLYLRRAAKGGLLLPRLVKD